MSLSKDKLLGFLFQFTVITLPVDSFPWPISFVYRPLTILPLVLTLLFFQSSKLFVKPKQIIIFCLLIVLSLVNSYLIGSYSGFIKFSIEVLLIIFFIHSINIFLIHIDREKVLTLLRKSINITLTVFAIIGSIQLFARFFNPNGVFDVLMSIFTHRFDLSRIQFLSGEPSMGIRMVIFFVSLQVLVNKEFSIDLVKITLFFLILLSGSTFGLVFTFIYLLLLIFIRKNFLITLVKKYFFRAVILILLISSTFPFLYGLLPVYAQNKMNILGDVISNVSFNNLLSIASLDGSFFLRVFNPIIGFRVFYENFLLGVGGENFQYYYIKYITEFYSFALNYPSVMDVKNNLSSITPKSLVARLLAEFGVIGLFLMLSFLKRMFHLRNIYSAPLIAYILALALNYDSYIYLPLIFSYLILNHLNETRNPSSKTQNILITN